MEHLVIVGFVLLNLFMIVGAVDLFYYHMWKYKLHTRPESIYEHKLHGIFALIMVPLAYFLYYQNSGGYALWAGVFFVAAALSVEMLDVFSEGDSRASIGGLTTGEYSLHVAATILKVASFSFIFASKPASAWSLEAPFSMGSYGSMGEMMAMQVMVGSLMIGLLHFVMLNKRIGSISFSSACSRLGCTSMSCCAVGQQS
ncbi:MAG TPA: hypothetical protein PKD26_03955 [Pyrinomonadaceae bacterium]|nr:hypothetical protein [Pyrinomonadaceae bacterium]